MSITRREMCILLPALMAAAGSSAEASTEHASKGQALPSAIYDLKDLPEDGNKGHRFIPVFQGNTYAGMHVELHETVLAPGTVVHGLYSHRGDELFLVREGLLEVEFHGKRSQVGPGSVAFVASDTVYAVRNTSTQTAKYFVFLFGPKGVPVDWKPSHT
jgi:mannose-6-phosphate isomerase-like protein (cupin superfamily)